MRLLLALATTLAALGAAAATPTAVLHDVLVPEGTGGSSTAQFVLTSSAPLGYDVIYDVTITPGTATSGDDYTEGPGTASFTLHAGTTSAVLNVPIVTDDLHEDDETFTVKIVDHNGNGPVLTNDTASCTILNDDVGFTPEVTALPVGETAVVHFDVGLALTSSKTVTFSSTDPSVVPSPSKAIVIPAGARFVEVPLTPLQDGFAQIVGLLSTGETAQIDITAFTVHTILASPQSLLLRPGTSGTLSLSLQPPSGIVETVQLATQNDVMIQIPDNALIPAGGFVDIPVHAAYSGKTTITITASHSSTVIPVTVDPNALIVDEVTPASGTPDGGTRIAIRGTGLSDSCVVLLGNLFATNVTFANNRLTATTPPHPPGTVDVRVACGAQETTVPHAFTFVRLKRRAAAR